MKKRNMTSRLTLNKETLRRLAEESLMRVEGGVRTVDGSCPASACHPTFCPINSCNC